MAQLQPSTLTGESYTGTIFEIGKRFAFINSEAVRMLHNDDVWCPSSALFGFGVGDNVEFDLMLSRKGQPQAANVRRAGGGLNVQLPQPPAQGEIHFGVVMEIGKRFAFIDCPAVKARYNDDVFCLSSSLLGYAAGAPVEFELRVNERGRPQAARVRPAQSQRATLPMPRFVAAPQSLGKGGGGPSLAAAGEAGVPCQGVIKEIGRRLAFIDSDYVRALCSDDVFSPSAALVGMSVGEEVLFDLAFNGKGQPQARNVRPVAQRPPGKGAGIATDGPWAMQSTPTGEMYQGTISDIGRKYAFIASAQAKAFYGDDVFCPARALVGLSVGQEVEFDLLLSAKGQPQAANVRPTSGTALGALGAGAGAAGAGGTVRGVSGGTPTGESYEGSISEIGKKLAFIASEKVKEKYDNDVFVPSHMLQGFNVGESVHFDLVTNEKGQPQAQNIKRAGGVRAAPY